LDEYIDLNPQYSNQSYRYFMNSNLFSKININLNNTFFPSKQTINGKYDLMIQNAGGANIALLGVGVNGHIAFNEPNSSIDSITRIVDLTSSTKEANARFFDNHSDFVPKQAVTCGLSTILAAKQIILIATGSNKKTALTQLKHATSFDPN
jgi:glucosamine-6-phosphate deaminase